MIQRYLNRKLFNTERTNANKLLQSRGISNTKIYETFFIEPLTDEEKSKYQTRAVIWQRRTRLYKLAHEFYGDSKLWWIIAWFNQKPTDSHFEPGERVLIPLQLEDILERVL